jgi:hypothetical protein
MTIALNVHIVDADGNWPIRAVTVLLRLASKVWLEQWFSADKSPREQPTELANDCGPRRTAERLIPSQILTSTLRDKIGKDRTFTAFGSVAIPTKHALKHIVGMPPIRSKEKPIGAGLDRAQTSLAARMHSVRIRHSTDVASELKLNPNKARLHVPLS